MSSFFARFEKPLMTAASKLGQQPHLNAIRDGVVGALPLLILGSIFVLASQPPLPPELAAKYAKIMIHGDKPLFIQIAMGSRILIGLVGVFVAFATAHSLAKRYALDQLAAGLLAVAALLLLNGMQIIPVEGVKDRFVPMTNLGASGMFMAIILGLLVPEVQRLVKKFKWEITMPAGVPPAVGRSFSALIPSLLVIIPLWVIVYIFGVDLFKLVYDGFTLPLIAMSKSGVSSFVFLLVVILIDSILWLLGIHAVAILAFMGAIWTTNIGMNLDHGTHLLNTRETMQFFIWVGGSGATVVLPFLLWRARATSLRAIARVSAVPALFNINEPLIFGVPVMMNATLAIPFILAPIVTLTTTVLATSYGLVPVPHLVVPWTLPGPVGAFFATGGAWPAAVLSVINMVLAGLIYWPFVRALDRRMAAQEAPETEPEATTAVT